MNFQYAKTQRHRENKYFAPSRLCVQFYLSVSVCVRPLLFSSEKNSMNKIMLWREKQTVLKMSRELQWLLLSCQMTDDLFQAIRISRLFAIGIAMTDASEGMPKSRESLHANLWDSTVLIHHVAFVPARQHTTPKANYQMTTTIFICDYSFFTLLPPIQINANSRSFEALSPQYISPLGILIGAYAIRGLLNIRSLSRYSTQADFANYCYSGGSSTFRLVILLKWATYFGLLIFCYFY